jgi:hypothetical protein
MNVAGPAAAAGRVMVEQGGGYVTRHRLNGN